MEVSNVRSSIIINHFQGSILLVLVNTRIWFGKRYR